MDLMRTAKCCCTAMDNIVLSPCMTLGLSSYNKKTGKASGTKSVSISASTSLLKLMIFLLSLMLFFRGMCLFFKMKKRRFYKKWARKKLKKHRKS